MSENRTEKEVLIAAMTRELATTLRVIQAFPQSEMHFKPHERSSSAEKVLKGIVSAMGMMQGALEGKMDMDKLRGYAPGDLMQISDDFEKASSDLLKAVEHASAEQLNKKVDFFGSEMRAIDIVSLVLFDQVHHRGQMSVYIRMAGGKVPSIYGPSADSEPGE